MVPLPPKLLRVRVSANYAFTYTITADPREGTVAVEMAVQQTRGQLKELSFEITDTRTSDFRADGTLLVGEDTVRWMPGRNGGSLHWRTRINHQRGGAGYDAWLDGNWGIFGRRTLLRGRALEH